MEQASKVTPEDDRMIPASEITLEDEIEATMAIFGVSRFTAIELTAIAHGESLGDCVGVDKNGREYSLLSPGSVPASKSR